MVEKPTSAVSQLRQIHSDFIDRSLPVPIGTAATNQSLGMVVDGLACDPAFVQAVLNCPDLERSDIDVFVDAWTLNLNWRQFLQMLHGAIQHELTHGSRDPKVVFRDTSTNSCRMLSSAFSRVAAPLFDFLPGFVDQLEGVELQLKSVPKGRGHAKEVERRVADIVRLTASYIESLKSCAQLSHSTCLTELCQEVYHTTELQVPGCGVTAVKSLLFLGTCTPRLLQSAKGGHGDGALNATIIAKVLQLATHRAEAHSVDMQPLNCHLEPLAAAIDEVVSMVMSRVEGEREPNGEFQRLTPSPRTRGRLTELIYNHRKALRRASTSSLSIQVRLLEFEAWHESEQASRKTERPLTILTGKPPRQWSSDELELFSQFTRLEREKHLTVQPPKVKTVADCTAELTAEIGRVELWSSSLHATQEMLETLNIRSVDVLRDRLSTVPLAHWSLWMVAVWFSASEFSELTYPLLDRKVSGSDLAKLVSKAPAERALFWEALGIGEEKGSRLDRQLRSLAAQLRN